MTVTAANIIYNPLTPEYFSQVFKLGNQVHGDGYLSQAKLVDWVARGINNHINCSYVALLPHNSTLKLVGFRLTFSAEQWQVDQWCSPHLWQVAKQKCCYFKCNTVVEDYRGLGIGRNLLQRSIEAATKQGAQAGVAHLWKQSPNNSAVGYFTHCGGEQVKSHPEKWNEESKQGYHCILCGHDCHCEAAEMIIYFK